ncbi:MAG: putative spermidine/putrescine transport system substrate-binding protein [Verrucomicrobiota bacterium]|jgi:putative spermidine/putrescine transport system substrate-binding protein
MSRQLKGSLCLAACIGLFATTQISRADEKVLYVGGSGGSIEKAFREKIIPPFEKKFNLKVEYVTGNSTDLLAKLQAQKANQQLDAVFVDDGPMYRAINLGFCKPLDAAPVYSDLYDLAKFPSNQAVMIAILGAGLMYNADYFKKRNWAVPTSWNDLKDTKYKQLILIPPLNNTYGLVALVAEARASGGSEKSIDPGFQAFKNGIGPNVLAYEPSPGKMTELFQSGAAVFAVWGSSRAKALQDTGFPVNFVYPKEGGYAIGIAMCPVAGAKDKPEAQEFIRHVLDPESQIALALAAALGPVNKKAELTAEQRVGIPYGEDQFKQLKALDWATINDNRDEWNRRWTREIER